MNKRNRIRFERPNLTRLTEQFTVVDLHFHTEYSDGLSRVKDVAKRALELGIGVAVTDHNEIQGAIEIDQHSDILSIPGIEITSREGSHVLVYFYDIESLKKFYRMHVKPLMGNDVMQSVTISMDEIVERARTFENVIIFPHPYCVAYTGICNSNFPKKCLDHLFDLVDGVEVINAQNMNKWNLQCAVLGFNLNKAITGGSDGHMLHHLGKVVTYSACPKDRKSFLDAIRDKQNKVIGRDISILKKVTSNTIKLRGNLKNYPEFVEKNIRYGRRLINAKSRILRENFKGRINKQLAKIQDK
jgi:predicted metal-dependent phosphoesterase TrpH